MYVHTNGYMPTKMRSFTAKRIADFSQRRSLSVPRQRAGGPIERGSRGDEDEFAMAGWRRSCGCRVKTWVRLWCRAKGENGCRQQVQDASIAAQAS